MEPLKFCSQLLLNLMLPARMSKLRELKRTQFDSPEVLAREQEARLLRLISHAKTSVPYYSELLATIEVRSRGDLVKIPFLTKKAIQANEERLKSAGVPLRRFVPNTTGGSTGEKLEMYSDKNTQQAAFIMRGNMWAGWNPGEKQLHLWGERHDLPAARGAYKKFVQKFVHRNVTLSSYNMNARNMLEYCRTINRHRPRLITAYTSALLLLSKFILENDIEIDSPKGLIGSAETLREEDRKIIEAAFRSKLFNRYGCREVGSIAQECGAQKGLHIHVDHLIVEIVDENGRPCKPGETGEIVVTALDNYAFPFIRYKVGDLGVMSGRTCGCGRGLPMLESVEGRVWDIIVGANGNRLVGTFWLVEDVKGICEYQIIQEQHDSLVIKLVVDNRFTGRDKQLLLDRVREKCGAEMKVDMRLLDSIPLTPGGKRRFVISHVSPFVKRQEQ